MKRNVWQAGRTCREVDRFSLPSFIVSTASSAGGIPLGVVVKAHWCWNYIAFRQLQHNYYTRMCFSWKWLSERPYNNSNWWQQVRKAISSRLQTTWPEATLLLWFFHYLQSRWTCLWDKKNWKETKCFIMTILCQMVYSHLERYYAKRIEPIIQSDLQAIMTDLNARVQQGDNNKNSLVVFRTGSLS